MNQLPPEDDLKDMFVVLDPPPGGLLRLRARRAASRRRPGLWLLAGTAVTAAAALALLLTPPAPQAPTAPQVAAAATPDLLAGRDPATLHPAWIGLRQLPPPAEPLTLAPEPGDALASRRIAVADSNVILYMLDPTEPSADR